MAQGRLIAFVLFVLKGGVIMFIQKKYPKRTGKIRKQQPLPVRKIKI